MYTENAPMLKKVCSLFLFQMAVIQLIIAQSIPHPTAISSTRMPRDQWIASVLDTLTLDQKIGQLMFVRSGSHQDIDIPVAQYHVGGIIFSEEKATEQTLSLPQKSFPLLIGVEAAFTSLLTLGAVQDINFLQKRAYQTAQQYRAMGIHVYFTPLVTVGNDDPTFHSPEANPLGTLSRSLTYMQGLERHGLIPCFRQLPNQEAQPREGLSAYQAASSLRGETVAQIGEVRELPMNTNPLQREDSPRPSLTPSWSLEGLVFSPSLSEYASSNKEKPGKLALEALRAGNDVLLDPLDIPAALKSIKKAVRSGQLSIEDIDRRVMKLLRLKYQVGLDGALSDTVRYHRATDPHSPLAQQQLYEQAITVARNEQNLLPIRVLDTLSFAALTITDQPEAAIPFQQSLDHYADFAYYAVPRSEKFDYEQTYAELKQYGHVIVSVQGFKPDDRSPVSKKTLSFLKFLQEEMNVTVVIFGPPQSLASFDSFNTLVCAYEDDPLAQKVVPQILFGALGATGKLPVPVSDALPQGSGENTPALGRLAYTFPEAVGLNEDTLRLIDSLAEWAIREKATPGCQVLVARKGAVVFQKSYGYQTYDKIEPVDDQTIYDIASLTKVTATMQAIMFLQERGAIQLDEKLATYLPELNATDKKNITVRETLLHRTGLRSFIPFWQMTRDKYGLHSELYRFAPEDQFTNQIADGLYGTLSLKDSIWNWTIHSNLLKRRGRRISWRPLYNYRYSDLGFYMLHRLVEQVTHQPMDEFLAQNFYDPLGLQTLMYNPLSKFPATRIAPTEKDTRFRKTLVRGTVHDEGAALIGGVAGHAGLFSSAHDLAVLMQMNLQDGYYGGTRYLQPGTVARFSTRQFQDSRRALGWDKPEHLHAGGATADEAAYSSYGHLGFTGTSVWVDPKYELVYVFLANRIYPDAQNTKLLTEGIRTKIQSVVYRAMDDYSGK